MSAFKFGLRCSSSILSELLFHDFMKAVSFTCVAYKSMKNKNKRVSTYIIVINFLKWKWLVVTFIRRMTSTTNSKFCICLTPFIFPRINDIITRWINRELDSNCFLNTHYKSYYK